MGRVVTQAGTLTPRVGPFEVVDAVVDLVSETAAGVHSSEIAGIGIGLPAQIDSLTESIEFCANLPLAGVDVRSLVMSRTHHSVTLANDCHCAGIGEVRFGAAKGVRDVVMITLGTGVGGALLLDGRPYRGSRGLGGEIGHMVVSLDGPRCSCGGSGHIESYVGRSAIGERGREAARAHSGAILGRAGGNPDAVTAEHVVQAALAGDDIARGILVEVGSILGEALVGIVNLLNPELIVVGGGIGESAGVLVTRAAEVVAEKALAGRRDVRVVRAVLGNDAGVLGAAALAFDECDSREGHIDQHHF
jgi:glucokinase